MTEQEQERMRDIHAVVGSAVTTLAESDLGLVEALGEGVIETIIGTQLAVIDAMFAIRDGEAWRGMTDPSEIARKLLREAKLGE
jgi:hypothetical protein